MRRRGQGGSPGGIPAAPRAHPQAARRRPGAARGAPTRRSQPRMCAALAERPARELLLSSRMRLRYDPAHALVCRQAQSASAPHRTACSTRSGSGSACIPVGTGLALGRNRCPPLPSGRAHASRALEGPDLVPPGRSSRGHAASAHGVHVWLAHYSRPGFAATASTSWAPRRRAATRRAIMSSSRGRARRYARTTHHRRQLSGERAARKTAATRDAPPWTARRVGQASSGRGK